MDAKESKSQRATSSTSPGMAYDGKSNTREKLERRMNKCSAAEIKYMDILDVDRSSKTGDVKTGLVLRLQLDGESRWFGQEPKSR